MMFGKFLVVILLIRLVWCILELWISLCGVVNSVLMKLFVILVCLFCENG